VRGWHHSIGRDVARRSPSGYVIVSRKARVVARSDLKTGRKKVEVRFCAAQCSTMTVGRPPPAENCPGNGMVAVSGYGYDRGSMVAGLLNVISTLMRTGGFPEWKKRRKNFGTTRGGVGTI